jgi:DNA-binding winged helix-turn-helix (wHTH) protein
MNPTEYRFGDYRLLPAARELWQDGRMLSVTRLAFDCIAYLVEHRHRAVGRDELVAALWGRVDVAEARVSELVLRARRTVGDDGQRQNAIRTVPGFGYRWVAETESLDAADGGDAATAQERDAQAPAVDGTAITAGAAPAETTAASAVRDETSRGAAPAQRRRRWTVAAILGFATLLVVAALAYALRERAREPAPAPAEADAAALAVLPLAVDAPREAGWVRLGAMDLIADRLRSAGLAVPPSENVLLALHGADAPAEPAQRDALARRLGVGTGVVGKATRTPSNWKVELDASVDGVLHHAEAEHADVIEAARRSADLLLAALGRPAPADAGERVATEERLQQAQAALLANQLDAARAILEAIPEGERSSPLVGYRLALVDFRGGRLDQAQAELSRLLDDPAVRADPLLQARAHTARGKVAFRRADFETAERDLGAALVLLDGRDAARDAADALATRGAARVGLRRFDEAAADLGRARSLFQEAGDRIGIAQADTNLGLLEAGRGRPERALAYLLGAADRFEAAGAVERVLAVRTSTFDVQLMLLRWTDALATGERQWQMREHAADPGLAFLIGVDRARALTGLGRHREARALLDELRPQVAGMRATVARYLHAADAELAWREERMGDAIAAADRTLAEWPDDGDGQRARVVLVRQRALVAAKGAQADLGAEPPAAASADAEAAATLTLAAAERAVYLGRTDAAERAYRAALEAAEASAAPIEIAGVATSYASQLIAEGRLDEASALAGRVAAWAERDFDCALLQVAVYRARGHRQAWADALRRAQALAGERAIPPGLSSPPP